MGLLLVFLAVEVVQEHRLHDRVTRAAFIAKLLDDWLELVKNGLADLGLEVDELFEAGILVGLEDLLGEEAVAAIQRENHLPLAAVLSLRVVDVLDDLGSERVHDELLDLGAHQLAEGFLLALLRCKLIQLGRQVVGVLLLNDGEVVGRELIDEQRSLGPVSEFDERLNNATSIVLEDQLRKLLANLVETFLDERVLLLSTHQLLLHDELVVVDLEATRDTG